MILDKGRGGRCIQLHKTVVEWNDYERWFVIVPANRSGDTAGADVVRTFESALASCAALAVKVVPLAATETVPFSALGSALLPAAAGVAPAAAVTSAAATAAVAPFVSDLLCFADGFGGMFAKAMRLCVV